MTSAPGPGDGARAWADGAAARFSLGGIRTAEFLALLYTPELAAAVEGLDAVVRDTPAVGTARRGRAGTGPRPAWAPRVFTDALPADLRHRLLVWTELVPARRHGIGRTLTPPDAAANDVYRVLHLHLREDGAPWEAGLLSLYLDMCLAHVVDVHSVLAVCERLTAGAPAEHLERLEEMGARRFGDRGDQGSGPPARGPEHVRLLRLLQRLDRSRTPKDVLPPGDLFGDLLSTARPDLWNGTGTADLLVHLLEPPSTRPSAAWRRRTAGHLAALPDAAATVLGILDLAPSLPEAGPRDRWDTSADHLRPHVQDILHGAVWCADLLPEEAREAAVPVLERTAVFTGTGPGGSRKVRAERAASAAVRVLAGWGGPHGARALARLGAVIEKETLRRVLAAAAASLPAASRGAP
ncbi:hypothetical protein [Nocardiopsis sp. NPDC057823]|uniref:hypothetical protein n=1 Tax=Nocardiopsis sp. NPDC057823 TaxID=3346256 RepID=UPI00366F778D